MNTTTHNETKLRRLEKLTNKTAQSCGDDFSVKFISAISHNNWPEVCNPNRCRSFRNKGHKSGVHATWNDHRGEEERNDVDNILWDDVSTFMIEKTTKSVGSWDAGNIKAKIAPRISSSVGITVSKAFWSSNTLFQAKASRAERSWSEVVYGYLPWTGSRNAQPGGIQFPPRSR